MGSIVKVELTEEEFEIFKKYATQKGKSVENLLKEALVQKISDVSRLNAKGNQRGR